MKIMTTEELGLTEIILILIMAGMMLGMGISIGMGYGKEQAIKELINSGQLTPITETKTNFSPNIYIKLK